MILTPIDGSEFSNVIELSQRKGNDEGKPSEPYRLVKGFAYYNKDGTKKCRHRKVLLDEARTEVECAECGAMLNPVWLLGEFMRVESIWSQQLAALKKQIAEADAKTRCKCQHCQKMTRIVR